MYIIKNGQIEAHAPSMAEVKDLFKFAQGRFNLSVEELQADIDAEASRQEFISAVTPFVEDVDAIEAPAPYVASATYVDGDSAIFGDKVFTKYQGQWIDPTVIPPAELQKQEEDTAPKPVSSIAGADVFKIAPVDTPASIVPPPPAASSPAPSIVPPPPPVAQTAAAAPANVDLDKRGIPWDARIHSSSKAKLATGNWKNLRGVDPALVAKVEAELFGAQSAPAAQPVTPVPPAADDAPADFTSLVMELSQLQIQGKISKEQIAAVVNNHGLTALPLLGTRPDLVPSVWAQIKALL